MKTVASNRRARYDYEIVDTFEAGILLSGQEVKSCRQGNINLAGSYVSLLDGKPVLKNASIAPYAYASGLENYNPKQDRTLLLTKKEIQKLETLLKEKGVTLVPLAMTSSRFLKVTLGLGKGKKRLDKRQHIKKREMDRKMRRGSEI